MTFQMAAFSSSFVMWFSWAGYSSHGRPAGSEGTQSILASKTLNVNESDSTEDHLLVVYTLYPLQEKMFALSTFTDSVFEGTDMTFQMAVFQALIIHTLGYPGLQCLTSVLAHHEDFILNPGGWIERPTSRVVEADWLDGWWCCFLSKKNPGESFLGPPHPKRS